MPHKFTKTIPSTQAFTLIELLVVIGIISVLATVGTINFGNAKAAARDAKRQEDMRNLGLGLRVYLARTNALPDQTVASQWNSFTSLLGASNTVPSQPQEDYCFYTDASQPLYALVATDFERALPVNAVTDISGMNLIVESGGDGNCYGRVDAGQNCGAYGSTKPDGGNDYCILFRILKLFD